MKYKICEIFYSIQGEGILQGLPMVFIRFSGCNLRCNFCDTKIAWEDGEMTEAEEIVEEIKKYSCKRVCLTGGEPYLQNLSSFVELLKERKYWVTAETNGTLWQKLPLDWLTVSPKKESLKRYPGGYDERFKNTASEFKYVITEEKDFEFVDKEIKKPVILQPVDNNLKIANKIVEFLKESQRENWYLRLQLHKTIKIK